MSIKGADYPAKEIRKLLDVGTGSVVLFEKEDDKIIIKPAKTLRELKGVLRGKGAAPDFAQMRKKAKKHIGKRVALNGKR